MAKSVSTGFGYVRRVLVVFLSGSHHLRLCSEREASSLRWLRRRGWCGTWSGSRCISMARHSHRNLTLWICNCFHALTRCEVSRCREIGKMKERHGESRWTWGIVCLGGGTADQSRIVHHTQRRVSVEYRLHFTSVSRRGGYLAHAPIKFGAFRPAFSFSKF